jgi:hypothetical protein
MMAGDVGYHCYRDGVDVTAARKSDQIPCYPSSGIGDGAYLHLDQHTNGLATLGRMGQAIPATYILKIYNGTSSKAFYEWKQPKPKQAVNTQTAYILNDMLSDTRATYLGVKFQSYKGWKIAVKTGTTNDNQDGLMMAWSTKYAVGTWVGYHTRTKALSGAMENLTMPVTRNIIQSALDSLNTQPVNWQQPAGIQQLPAFRSALAYGTQSSPPATDLYPSWYKPKTTTSQTSTVDKVSGKLATNCTPPLAKQTLGGNASPNAFSIDPYYPPGQGTSPTSTANPAASDDVHSCSDSPPAITLTPEDRGNGTMTLTAFVSAGTHPFNNPAYAQYPGTVTFSVNGQVVGTKNVNDPQDTVSIDYTAPGGGSYSVSATVTDSVLYSATDTKTLNLVLGAVSPRMTRINLSIYNLGGDRYRFNWNTIPGATSYNICIDTRLTPDFVCTAGNPGDTRIVSDRNRKAYISSNTGVRSDTENF